jgi:hypothetical protein
MAAIEADLKARGVHSLFAGVSGENEAGVPVSRRPRLWDVARLPAGRLEIRALA